MDKTKINNLLLQRKEQLSQLIGVPFETVIERFEADIFGCLSGGSNERDYAREWLLFCFNKYFGSSNHEADEDVRGKLHSLLQGFSEPTIRELENL